MSAPPPEQPRSVTTQVGKRGVLVIPAAFRRWFGLDESAPVVVEASEDGLLIRPARRRLSDEQRREMGAALTADYDALFNDPEAGAAYLAEFSEWERLAGEPLSAEKWTDEDFVPDAS